MFPRGQTQDTPLMEPAGGWVLFDDECPFCTRLARAFAGVLRPRGFRLAPLQATWARAATGMRPGETPAEMLVLLASGAVLGGADAVAFLARRIWWAWPLYAISLVPPGMRALRVAYRWIAAHRTCRTGHRASARPNV